MGECVIGPGARARVDADDGFFFGMGAFETIAVSGGAPLLLDDHLTRLGETLRYLGIEARRADLETMVLRACAGLGASDDSALKLTVTERSRAGGEARLPLRLRRCAQERILPLCAHEDVGVCRKHHGEASRP